MSEQSMLTFHYINILPQYKSKNRGKEGQCDEKSQRELLQRVQTPMKPAVPPAVSKIREAGKQ